ncbi:porin [Aliamphritea hakodatensis]|uniref:porin n=1 Tax=Aliamphritea hakodatensis TaxID=2895352 RepID=UPI0022FDAB03|nr:porin [Aliamphritea hakodatensis]
MPSATFPRRTAFCLLPMFLTPAGASAGILIKHPDFSVVADAYLNLTTGNAADNTEHVAADADIRLLGLYETAGGNKYGGRITFESSSAGSNNADPEVGEYSLLAQSDWGRIEVGERQGLPDVLTGFAPNNYTFTFAEYGPSTGRNLNPAGGLQTSFIDAADAASVNQLSSLGFVASLAGDRSAKLIYAAPRSASGINTGISYAPDISEDNPGFKQLIQTGLTYDYYWDEHQLHLGGSYTYANAEDLSAGQQRDDLSSVNLGISATFNSKLALGISTTLNGTSGQLTNSIQEDTRGWVTSLNYNSGPWTYGGFYQQAYGQGETQQAGRNRLEAYQLGVSYRFNIRTRLYTAYYHYDLSSDNQNNSDGDVVLFGVRIIL